MADEQKADTSQVDEQAVDESQVDQEAGQELDPKTTAKELKEARADAAKYRAELRKLQAAQTKRDEAELSEGQKIAKRLKDLEDQNAALLTERQERIVSSAVADAARDAGAIYPDDVYALLKADVELTDEGKVRNVMALINSLKSRRPALFSTVSGDGGAGRASGARSNNMNDLIRAGFGWQSK